MDIQEVLQWTDEQVFAKTGKYLDSLQKAILEGTWQRHKYGKIAESYHCSHDHVKKEAWKLWKILSDVLEIEDIKQSNVRSILESKAVASIYNFGNSSQIVSSNINSPITICGEKRQYAEEVKPPSASDPPQTPNRSPIIDLTDAPEFTSYYDRTAELSTLKQWILEARTRAIALYGLSGIGKSAIALKLIEEIQTEFDYIIWRSLNNAPAFSTLQTDLKQFFSRSQPNPLPTVIDYFRSSRCLVILDDVQNIFKSGELAGQYLPGYEDYGKFFKQVATSSHRSCLILLSWEKPREIATLEAENQAARSLDIHGLEAAEEIFRNKALIDKENWSELIGIYQGHPSWLNIIAATIVELFNGSVSLFLAEQNSIFLGDIEPLLDSHLERLSESEKQAIAWLARQAEAVDISQRSGGDLSKTELWQVIQSLGRRALVGKVQVAGRTMFQLNPIFQQYIQCKLR